VEGSATPNRNMLLSLLPEAVYALLRPHLEHVHFPAGTVLHEPDQAVRHCVFPVSGLIGRVAMTSDGKSTELTVCGSDGMIGISLLLGGRPLSSRALVIADADAFRLSSQMMASACRPGGALQQLMLRYVQVMLQEVIQVALCNKHHSIEQQLSRWLLMSMDRVRAPTVHVTQALISHMLGVRREGITETAGKLEAKGIVKRDRGAISIVNRSALERTSCECYGVIRRNYERLVTDARTGVLTGVAEQQRQASS
jgi:CRP-like cAMP-binding protein